jgi:predicted nucleic acid-binding protein
LTLYFLDSSALVKRYVTETGSAWILTLADPAAGHTLIVARITWVEVFSAFARLQRENTLSEGDVSTALRAFQYDWNTQYQVVELTASLMESAGQLLFKHPLRAYDSIQLAAALQLLPAFAQTLPGTYTFVTADARLLVAASAEGLPTDDPNRHLYR